MALTRRQRQVLDVIHEFIEANGYSPSLEEIGSALELSSVATVHKHVSHLVEKGYVRRVWNQNRSIELVEAGEEGTAVRIPLCGVIAAGTPLVAVDTSSSSSMMCVPRDLVRDHENTFVLKVQGDSMINEQIRDGDFVVLERRSVADDGETVVALIDDTDVTLKKLYREGSKVRLQPANPSVEAIVVAANRVQVQGVVVGVIRKY